MKKLSKRAFTLIELLTVMAISAILMGLIVLPLFQSFGLTRTAQAFADAQDRARVITERIAKEVGNAAFVRTTEGVVQTTLNGTDTTVGPSTVIIRVPAAVGGTWPGGADDVEVALAYSKMDLWMPAEGDPVRGPSGAYVDPVTGKEDPTLQSPKGQVNLPNAMGAELVRYFVVLRDPFARYNNPYDGLLMAKAGNQDNLYTLVRAKVVPYVWRLNRNGDANSEAYRPNLAFFDSDPETDSRIVDFDDPKFMLPNVNAGVIVSNDAKADRIRNWMRVAVRLTDVSRFDMIQPVYNKFTHVVSAQPGNPDAPQIVPLIQFRPATVSNDPAEPMASVRPGEESDASGHYGSDVFVTQYGLWGHATVRVYPRGFGPFGSNQNEYLVAHRSPTNPNRPMSIYVFDPDSNGGGVDNRNPISNELFDINAYKEAARIRTLRPGLGIYPFSIAVNQANNDSNWLARASDDWRQLFTPFTYNRDRGRIITSFGIDEVGIPVDPLGSPAAPPVANNLPTVATGAALTPDTDTSLVGNFFDADFATINRKYNKIFADYPSLRAGNVHRFIDLRVVPNSDGMPSPLYPVRVAGRPTAFLRLMPDGSARSRVTITPGSDVVYGPDQNPGPNYGSDIRYTRIASGQPGPNQYRINYTDLPEPTTTGGQVDAAAYANLFPDLPVGGFNPVAYDPQNLISAVIQPRYKVGYIQLYSGPDVPLPQGTFRIYYKFQFTGNWTGSELVRDSGGGTLTTTNLPSDQITVDYDTRQLMDVLLTIRNYPQSNVPNPQTVTLKSTATVRNFSR